MAGARQAIAEHRFEAYRAATMEEWGRGDLPPL
jgi:hypothetical protein